ncbi:MAG: S-layer homology domain-containing protein [Oscillospiraceae bacterium]|nr:S-layer homology domain-containing protein [Oscillospiraceae bacterium]
MKKRLLSILLILTMLLTMLPMTALAEIPWGEYLLMKNANKPVNPFADVNRSDWYHDSVMYVYVNDLFKGVSDTAFDPNGTMTRGMFVTVLGRLAGVDADRYAGQSDFADVPADAYYAPYVAWAAKYGITTGVGSGYFSPNASINRQQLASFLVRYFDALHVTYNIPDHVMTAEEPVDFDRVADWAKDDVRQLWQTGVLVGDGVSFDPYANASRAQAATICDRLDAAVGTWYKELGEASDRVRLDPETGLPYGASQNLLRQVSFYDGDRLIDRFTTIFGMPLDKLPAVEKSSKEGAVLLGYYYDEDFTEPFFASNCVFENTKVYAKYREMDRVEDLTVRTFTRMDVPADVTFVIRRTNGSAGSAEAAKLAATLESNDGSDPVELAASPKGGGAYTIYAPEGFNEGCSYELTLADGWMFDGKEETIRTASFSIFREEVKNIRMGDEIVYIKDTAAISYSVAGGTYDVLTSDVLDKLPVTDDTVGTGTFPYSGSEQVEAGDVLCIYEGTHPLERGSDASVLDPAVYVQAVEVNGSRITFSMLDDEARQDVYEVPDNFPINVPALPGGETGTVSLTDLDISMYESMIGVDIGTLDYARSRLSEGDFITLYVSKAEDGSHLDSELYFARVEGFSGDTITFRKVTRQDIIESMDLYTNIDLTAADLLDENTMHLMAAQMSAQIEDSGFAQEAVYVLSDFVASTEQFRNDPYLRERLTDENGAPVPANQIDLLGEGGFAIDDIDLDVNIGTGSEFDGVEITIGVDAELSAKTNDGVIEIGLTASFTEEAMVAPGVKGELVYKEILGIPIPIGVYIGAHVDMKNYTAFSFAAEMTTRDNSNAILSTTGISSDLEEFINVADETGLSEEYYRSLDELMKKYSDMLRQETDWVELLEQQIFNFEVCYFGLVLGVEADFVVRTDMSIAIGSSLEYKVGKRYNFWFKIGLFTPTAGSDTMDLIDETFKFQFYVMGKLGVKAGVKAKIYAGIGTGSLASVGIAAELGPYVKLYGLFIYNYERTRQAGSEEWKQTSDMLGGLDLEFGLYLIFSFEAEALGMFEYSYDFVDEEFPLLEAGESRYYYNLFYQAQSDQERVFIWDEDRDSRNGITMELPQTLRALSYVDLKTGTYGAQVMDYSDFSVTMSSPYFTLDEDTGKISVKVPDSSFNYLECDITITYLHGKMPFSRYDMTTTVPVAWTDLSRSDLKEYHTVSVLVGEDDHYEELWTKRVRKGQPFDLPDDEEIRELADWSDLKFRDSGSGYRVSQTTDLTVSTDTVYYYDVERQLYTITVDGVQNKDGSTESRQFSAYYGETFDFSSLEKTYTEVGDTYTRFANVTTTTTIPTRVKYEGGSFAGMGQQAIDLSRPITGEMAKALKKGITATANYVDDSVTAVFTFNGLTHTNVEDVTITLRKGTRPGTAEVDHILETEVLKNTGEQLGIKEIYPEIGVINACTNYVVTCVGLSGERAWIRFNGSPDFDPYYFYDVPKPIDKLVGSLIVNIPDADRRGYTFVDWFTEHQPPAADDAQTGEAHPDAVTGTSPDYRYDVGEAGGYKAVTQTVPQPGLTLYAKWQPNTYLVSFDVNNSEKDVTGDEPAALVTPEDLVVTYDELYSDGYFHDPSKDVDHGATVAKEYGKGEAYGSLPVLPFTATYGFLGWSTTRNRVSVDSSVEEYDQWGAPLNSDNKLGEDIGTKHRKITDVLDCDYEALANVFESDHTLYAQWKERVDINAYYKAHKDLFSFTDTTVVYDGESHTATASIDPNATYEYVTYDGSEIRSFEDIGLNEPGDTEGSGFRVFYKRDGYLTEWQDEAVHAGVYDVKIYRPGDNDFKEVNIIIKGVFEITKAPTTLDEAPTEDNVTQYYANLLPNTYGLSYSYTRGQGEGIGAYEFAVTTTADAPGSDAWTSGPVYNVNQGEDSNTFYLWARLGEGENYSASAPKSCRVTLENNPGNLSYKLVVKTADKNWAGTDSNIEISFNGGSPVALNNCLNGCSNCFEGGSEDVFEIPASKLSGTAASFEIRKDKAGSYEGWYLKWLRIDTYEGDTLVQKGTPWEYEDWLEDDVLCAEGTISFLSYSNSFSVYGPSSVGLDGSSTTVGIEANEDAYEHYGAPEFKAYFKEPGFDRLIDWDYDGEGEWYASFDHDEVLEQMELFDYEELTFRYGVYDTEHIENWYEITVKR